MLIGILTSIYNQVPWIHTTPPTYVSIVGTPFPSTPHLVSVHLQHFPYHREKKITGPPAQCWKATTPRLTWSWCADSWDYPRAERQCPMLSGCCNTLKETEHTGLFQLRPPSTQTSVDGGAIVDKMGILEKCSSCNLGLSVFSFSWGRKACATALSRFRWGQSSGERGLGLTFVDREYSQSPAGLAQSEAHRFWDLPHIFSAGAGRPSKYHSRTVKCRG